MSAAIPLPLREDERAELVRLRALEDTTERPVIEIARELAGLRRLAAAVEHDMAKVAEHEHRGYDHIRVGAFAATRAALEARK